MDLQATASLNRWEKIGLGALVFFLIAFGALVEKRSAFLTRRMGDLDVFLRAAWAVRTGGDPYAVTSDNDWHYLYPPLYAILLTPLADPPPGQDTTGYMPYAWSVAICYLLSLGALFWGAHILACALEERADDASFRRQSRFCRRWWVLRLWPILICWLPIGHTLMRGQANLVVLACLCATLAGWMRQQNFRAGMWLSLAICIKVIPVYLLVYPLWKRDGRGLLGCAAGLLAGLLIIPLLVFGPAKTQTHYTTYGKVFFAPFFKIGNEDHDPRLDEEIMGGVNATESVGVRNAVCNWMHPDPYSRPKDLTTVGKAVYVLLGIGMTFLVLWPGTLGGETIAGRHAAHPFAALILLMAIFSPVCHSHYLMFCLPVVMSLLADQWQFQPTVRLQWLLMLTLSLFFATMAIAYLPHMEILKDRCASLFATVPLWGLAIAQLWRSSPRICMALPEGS